MTTRWRDYPHLQHLGGGGQSSIQRCEFVVAAPTGRDVKRVWRAESEIEPTRDDIRQPSIGRSRIDIRGGHGAPGIEGGEALVASGIG